MTHIKTIKIDGVKGSVFWAVGVSFILSFTSTHSLSQAAGFSPPQECESSTGQAHLDCLYGYIEKQQKSTHAREADVQTQGELLEQMDSQTDSMEGQRSVPGREEPLSPAASPMDRSTAVQAPDPLPSATRSPYECLAYSGAAHLNCLYAYIEIQRGRNGNIEEELKAQNHMLGQLRNQMDRQASANQEIQRRLAERDVPSSSSASVYVAPPIYPGFGYPGYGYLGYGYGYSAPGLSLYLGVPGYYWGRPFYGPRLFGHRFHGHRHR